MSAGFRKSIFGFNTDDVMQYIEKTHKDFVEKETVLNENIEELASKLENAENQIAEILAEKESIETKLKEYDEKHEEIERLAQNIGKLYLVAETNANSVLESTKQNKEIAQDEVFKNIDCADKTYASLATLKDDINKMSDDFSARVNSLMLSLQRAKDDIRVNNDSASKEIEKFREFIDSVKI